MPASQARPSAGHLTYQRNLRAHQARRHKPERITLLLVAEAPPGYGRYFYAHGVYEHDHLYRAVVRGILKQEPVRGPQKELQLDELHDRGVFLMDLKLDPVDGTPLSEQVPGLIRRVRKLSPKKIILIKATVYDAAFIPLRDAGLPVVDERIPFPASGWQREFEVAFARALRKRPARRAA